MGVDCNSVTRFNNLFASKNFFLNKEPNLIHLIFKDGRVGIQRVNLNLPSLAGIIETVMLHPKHKPYAKLRLRNIRKCRMRLALFIFSFILVSYVYEV
jgi:hypothetical protein